MILNLTWVRGGQASLEKFYVRSFGTGSHDDLRLAPSPYPNALSSNPSRGTRTWPPERRHRDPPHFSPRCVSHPGGARGGEATQLPPRAVPPAAAAGWKFRRGYDLPGGAMSTNPLWRRLFGLKRGLASWQDRHVTAQYHSNMGNTGSFMVPNFPKPNCN